MFFLHTIISCNIPSATISNKILRNTEVLNCGYGNVPLVNSYIKHCASMMILALICLMVNDPQNPQF